MPFSITQKAYFVSRTVTSANFSNNSTCLETVQPRCAYRANIHFQRWQVFVYSSELKQCGANVIKLLDGTKQVRYRFVVNGPTTQMTTEMSWPTWAPWTRCSYAGPKFVRVL